MSEQETDGLSDERFRAFLKVEQPIVSQRAREIAQQERTIMLDLRGPDADAAGDGVPDDGGVVADL